MLYGARILKITRQSQNAKQADHRGSSVEAQSRARFSRLRTPFHESSTLLADIRRWSFCIPHHVMQHHTRQMNTGLSHHPRTTNDIMLSAEEGLTALVGTYICIGTPACDGGCPHVFPRSQTFWWTCLAWFLVKLPCICERWAGKE
jgi:hypothetical protein